MVSFSFSRLKRSIFSAFSDVLTGFGVTDGNPAQIIDMFRNLERVGEFFFGMNG
jgi:hypothetical protein